MALSATLLLASCGASDVCSTQELSRTPSPNGRVDAVIVTKDCGATTSEAIKVHVVVSGGEVDSDQFVFLSDKTEGFTLNWRDDHTLALKYLNARIFQYRNFWSFEKLNNSQYEVRITESQMDN